MTAFAPRATALTTSLPRRTPPSQMTSSWSPTAWTTGSTRSMVAGAVSSWRPPWLESATASMPMDAAISASATDWMPLITSGPSHTDRSHSMSSQQSEGSNWPLM